MKGGLEENVIRIENWKFISIQVLRMTNTHRNTLVIFNFVILVENRFCIWGKKIPKSSRIDFMDFDHLSFGQVNLTFIQSFPTISSPSQSLAEKWLFIAQYLMNILLGKSKTAF